MADGEERSSRSAMLRERVRSTFGEVRRKGADSLRGVRSSVASATEKLKSTQTAEQLGAAVEIRRVIKKAADAQRRGNHAMAYRLLEPEVRERPDDVKLVVAFWTAALACERPEDAAPAMLRVIRKLASTGKPMRAAELWMELRRGTPSALVDPNSLVRIVQVLREEGRKEEVVEALREAVEPDNTDLSPGLAVRIAEMARELDPPTALTAASRALATPDLHEARRERLERLVSELSELDKKAAADAPSVAPPASGTAEAAVSAALEATAPGPQFSDIKLTEGMPTRLLDEGVALQLLGGRRARLEYEKIEALSVAAVMGQGGVPLVLIDLVQNWSERGARALKVVRFRSDGFDPRMVIEAPDDATQALQTFLSELLARCNAIPLPDPESALGVNVRAFESIESYQREVLRIGSARNA